VGGGGGGRLYERVVFWAGGGGVCGGVFGCFGRGVGGVGVHSQLGDRLKVGFGRFFGGGVVGWGMFWGVVFGFGCRRGGVELWVACRVGRGQYKKCHKR